MKANALVWAILLGGVFLFAFFGNGTARETTVPAGLIGREIITTGQFGCDGTQHQTEWQNNTGGALYVRQAQVWLGMYQGAVADFWVWLATDSGNVLGHSNWDHYADPTNLHNLRYVYAPDFVLLEPGQAVILFYGCQDIEHEPATAVGDAVVTLWWLEERP